MSTQHIIEEKLKQQFLPAYLLVLNESHMHSVPDNSETHFKVVIAANAFLGKRLVKRHQLIYQVLDTELASGVHALALHTYTPEEWQGVSPDSPQCLGGSKDKS